MRDAKEHTATIVNLSKKGKSKGEASWSYGLQGL